MAWPGQPGVLKNVELNKFTFTSFNLLIFVDK
jgi:hypothetical protein